MNTAEGPGSVSGVPPRIVRLSFLRRIVLLAVFSLFLLQYAGIGLLVGSLSGSVLLGTVKFIDVFAFLETQFGARELTITAILAVLPVAGLYLAFGRAFCGWVCPMDFLFSAAARLRRGRRETGLSPRLGYGVMIALLAGSFLAGIPLFTNCLSHLTNIFRGLSAASSLGELQGSLPVLLYSASVIVFLLLLELISPRLWCRVLCPVGKTYGLFNRVSLLRLRFSGTGCSGCGSCEEACYMRVRIVRHGGREEIRDSNCIYCGRCGDVCREKEGAVSMGFRRQ